MDFSQPGNQASDANGTLDALQGREIVLRPNRLKMALVWALVIGGAGYGTFVNPTSLMTSNMLAYAFMAGILGTAFLLLVYYTFFCIVTVDETSITQMRYFGLAHKRILIRDLVAIRASLFEGWRINKPSVRFCTADDEIVMLSPEWTPELKRAITLMEEAGVPLDRLIIAALDR